jgi:hypothetical protein
MTVTEGISQKPWLDHLINEGDWLAYLSASTAVDTASRELIGDPIATKRGLALGYLGRRAQAEGAVYSRREPRVLTSDLAHTLEADNRSQRYLRYPWLERPVKLLLEIECAQEEICLARKVLPFALISAK